MSDLAEALVGFNAIRVAVPRALLDAHPWEVRGAGWGDSIAKFQLEFRLENHSGPTGVLYAQNPYIAALISI